MRRFQVTIGLPVYNGENYLGEAIKSLVEQTFENFRLIISDNASTDATEEISRAAAQSDRRIEYHRHDRNLGASANYNFAVSLANSPFFMWHAHDDTRSPEYLERAVGAHEKSSDASIVFSRARILGPDGEIGEMISRPNELLSLSDAQRFRAAITCRTPDIILFGLMRLEFLLRTGKHGAMKGGDRLLIAEMALLGPFVEIDEVLFFNRDHPARYVRMRRSGPSAKEKVTWWDTAAGDRISLPRWSGFIGYWKAVKRLGRGGAAERMRSYWAILSSLRANRFYIVKQLGRESAEAIRELGERLWNRLNARRI